MKKTIILSFVLLSTFIIKAQTTPWISQGATWFYTWYGISYGGNNKIEYTHDTVLFGKTGEILKTTSYIYGMPGPWLPIDLISTQILPYNYTYCNGDTVFYLNNDHFNILYNFGAQINNKWNLGVDTNNYSCSKSIVKVDSVSLQTINSNSHRVLYTSDSANSAVGIAGKIIEHIGSLNYLFPIKRNCGTPFVDDQNTFKFSCFQDNTMSYMLVTQAECENPYHVEIDELAMGSNHIRCFPNPVEDKLNVNFFSEKYYRICIYNLLGENIIETRNQNNLSVAIDMSNLTSGIYIATFYNKLGKNSSKIIVKK